MTRLSPFIRSTPKLFYFVAVLDFLRYMIPLAELYFDGRFNGVDYEVGVRISVITMVLTAIVYAVGWAAYGVVATLLIAIYDRIAEDRTDATEPEATE